MPEVYANYHDADDNQIFEDASVVAQNYREAVVQTRLYLTDYYQRQLRRVLEGPVELFELFTEDGNQIRNQEEWDGYFGVDAIYAEENQPNDPEPTAPIAEVVGAAGFPVAIPGEVEMPVGVEAPIHVPDDPEGIVLQNAPEITPLGGPANGQAVPLIAGLTPEQMWEAYGGEAALNDLEAQQPDE